MTVAREKLKQVLARIEQRLLDLGLTASKASALAGLSESAIRNMQRAIAKNGSRVGVSTATITKLAPILETTVSWLMDGPQVSARTRAPSLGIPSPGSHDSLTIDEKLQEQIAEAAVQTTYVALLGREPTREERAPLIRSSVQLFLALRVLEHHRNQAVPQIPPEAPGRKGEKRAGRGPKPRSA